jgi:hypothetical protein
MGSTLGRSRTVHFKLTTTTVLANGAYLLLKLLTIHKVLYHNSYMI